MARKNFRATGGIDIDTSAIPVSVIQETITSNSATTVDTVALNSFVSCEYTISLVQGSKIRTSKVFMQTDGTSVDMTEFGITETGGLMSGVAVSATTESTNAVLQVTVTDAASTLVRYKIVKNIISSISYVPDAPTIGTATGGAALAIVTFTAPSDDGGSAVTSYTVTSNPGNITASGSSSPITVTSLTPGTAYTFTVTATNANGTSSASSATNSVTPTEPPIQAGYTAGQRDGVGSTTVDKMRFDTETTSTLATGNTLGGYTTVSNSGVAGYLNLRNSSISINKFTYDGDTRSTLTSGFTFNTEGGSSYSNSGTAGYVLGGSRQFPTPSGVAIRTASKLTYSNETGSNLGDKLTFSLGSAGYVGGHANVGVAGYVNGGRNADNNQLTSTIQKMTFSNESNSNIAATIGTAAEDAAAFSNSGTAGYATAGTRGSSIFKLIYSNDTSSTLASGLSGATLSPGAAGNAKVGSAGYLTGLWTGSAYGRLANKISFSNDTVSSLSNVLSTARGNVGGFSNSGVL